MKTKHIFYGLATLVLITLMLSGCKKEAATNSGMALKITAPSPVSSVPPQEGTSGTPTSRFSVVHWDVARLVVSRIMFEAETISGSKDGDSHEVQFFWHGPKVIDLLNEGATLGDLPVPPGQYQEVEFTVYADKRDAGSIPVFYLSGTYTTSTGTSIPLIISISDDVVFRTEKEHVTLTADNTLPLSGIIRIYLDNLFSSILPRDLENSVMTDGSIIISATSNPELYQKILENLGRDGDAGFENED